MLKKLKEVIEILEWLESHNKNYNKEQYYRIVKVLDLLKGEYND